MGEKQDVMLLQWSVQILNYLFLSGTFLIPAPSIYRLLTAKYRSVVWSSYLKHKEFPEGKRIEDFLLLVFPGSAFNLLYCRNAGQDRVDRKSECYFIPNLFFCSSVRGSIRSLFKKSSNDIAVFQSRAVLSETPASINFPSGEKATLFTLPM
jgi:hypothetical protein